MDYRSSMLSFIQTILSRPHSPSPTSTGQKRKRSIPSLTKAHNANPNANPNVNPNTPPTTASQDHKTDSEITLDQEAAIASFLALPDGPLVKRVRMGDDEDVSGSAGRERSARLSVIQEGAEEEHQGEGGVLKCMENGKGVDGRYGGQCHGDDKDVEMEDVDLGAIEVEQGLWTYRGGSSVQR